MTNKKSFKEALKELAAPFTSGDVEWRIQSKTKDRKKGQAVPYINIRSIAARLNEVVGPENWQNDIVEWQMQKPALDSTLLLTAFQGDNENSMDRKGLKSFLENYYCSSVKACLKLYDWDNERWIEKWDAAPNTDIEGVKGGVSDAMKRVCVHFGMGAELYGLDNIWVELKDERYIADHEIKRLNAIVDGDKNAKYPSWHDKKSGDNSQSGNNNPGDNSPSGNNNPNSKTDNATVKQKAVLRTNKAELGLTDKQIDSIQKSEATRLIDSLYSGSNNSSEVQSKGEQTQGENPNGSLPNEPVVQGDHCSAGQVRFIRDLAPKAKITEEYLLNYYKVASLDQLTKAQAKECIDKLRNQQKAS